MEESPQIWKRKACDVCHSRKIRCDGAHPSCSNCILYGTQCKTSAVRRRTTFRKVGATTRAQGNKDSDYEAANRLEARVASLEEQLARLNQQHQQLSLENCENGCQDPERLIAIYNSGQGSEKSSGTAAPLTLPPLDEIVPTVERYFEEVNPFIPLFEKTSFIRMMMDWYNPVPLATVHSAGSQECKFAAINVVLGLSYRLPDISSNNDALAIEDPRVEYARQSIESLTNYFMRSPEQLLSLQALLGLILLRIGCKDPQPATILIGSAVQLCNRLFLNDPEENNKFPPEVKLQRERAIWITYILDRDISMRYHTAPLLSREPGDLDLPSQHYVCIHSSEDTDLFDYFNSRIQLANVQGRLYEQIYSNSATPQKLTIGERRTRMDQLDADIETWHRSLPGALQLENIVNSLSSPQMQSGTISSATGTFQHMTELYSTYMMCLVRVHGVWSHDAEWLNCISSFQRQLVHDCAMPRSRCATQLPPLPEKWNKCVKVSRVCLELAHSGPFSGINEWNQTCAYVSSLIILLANLFYIDDLEQAEKDQQLSRQGLLTFSRLREASSWKTVHQLQSVIVSLNDSAAQNVASRLIQSSFDTVGEFTRDEDTHIGREGSMPTSQDFSMAEWSFSDDPVQFGMTV